MKVAFPTNNGEKIARHASLCQSFLIVDTETGELVSVPNPIKADRTVSHDHSDGERHGLGTGRIVPELLAAHGASLYVCLEAGERLHSRLNGRGIGVSVVSDKQIGEVLKHLEELQPLPLTGSKPSVDAEVDAFGGRGLGRREHNGSGQRRGRRCENRGRGEGRSRGVRNHEGRSETRGGGFGRGCRSRY